ncbi:MAG: hypothetical protein KJP02_08970, partial [Octadecabacter sp.]|nr:hypothetical protein [Octadecabacter sp.]
DPVTTPMGFGSHFITYSNDNPLYAEHAERYRDSALACGFTSARFYREADLQRTPFWAQNQAILSLPRGAGYWLWKPYIILEQLRSLPEGDVLLYSDAGRGLVAQVTYFDTFPENILRCAHDSRKGFIVGLTTNWGIQGILTKPRCFDLMQANTADMQNAAQVQATWSVWKHCPEAIAFLEDWLSYCTNPDLLLDDGPEHLGNAPKDFRDHRHDQAICSILAHRHRAQYFALHDPSIKTQFNLVRSETSVKSDVYKRVGTTEALLRLLLEEEASDDPKWSRARVMARVLANQTGDDPIPDLSEGRRNKSPLMRIADYVNKVNEAEFDTIGWSDIWPAMRSTTKRGFKTLIDGLKRPAVEELRAEIVDDHKAWLAKQRLEHGAAFYESFDHQAAKDHFEQLLQPRLDAGGIVLPEVLWSQLSKTLLGVDHLKMRSLVGRLPKDVVDDLRIEWAKGFHDLIQAQPNVTPEEIGRDYFAKCLDRVYDGLPEDHPAQVWRRIEVQFSKNQALQWLRLCAGKQLHLIIAYQNIMMAALEAQPEAPQNIIVNALITELRNGAPLTKMMRRHSLLEDAPESDHDANLPAPELRKTMAG